MSVLIASPCDPRLWHSAAVFSISGSRRPAIRTAAAPSSAILSAAARPIPLPPPVTRQTFPRIRSTGMWWGALVGKDSPITPNSLIVSTGAVAHQIVVCYNYLNWSQDDRPRPHPHRRYSRRLPTDGSRARLHGTDSGGNRLSAIGGSRDRRDRRPRPDDIRPTRRHPPSREVECQPHGPQADRVRRAEGAGRCGRRAHQAAVADGKRTAYAGGDHRFRSAAGF